MSQFFLRCLGNDAGDRYRSGSTVLHDIRPLSSGTQSYDTKKVDWPVDEPLKKLEADIQVYLYLDTPRPVKTRTGYSTVMISV